MKIFTSNSIIYLLLVVVIVFAFAGNLHFDQTQKKNTDAAIQSKAQSFQTNVEVEKNKINIQEAKTTSDNAATQNAKTHQLQKNTDQDIRTELKNNKLAIARMESEIAELRTEITHKKRPIL